MNSAEKPTKAESLTYLNIVISEKGLSEFSHGRRVVFIPKDEIQKIEVKYGSSAERPLLQSIVGLLLAGLGVVGLAMIDESGMRGLRWGAGFLVFGGFGAWLLYETFKKTHYLQVTCLKGRRKLVFKGAFRESEFSEFTQNAVRFGHRFDESTASGAPGPARSQI